MVIKPPVQGEKNARMLAESVRSGYVTHSYIFEGDAGLGKVETAAYFAASLLCENKSECPCGECDSCRQISNNNNPDLKSYSLKQLVERDKKSIGVGEIRSVIEDVYTKPFKSEYKVYIIEDGDALTNEAQNAMLKVLEEPPEYAVFIMCVTAPGKILPTVQSRCRVIKFYPASEAEAASYVRKNYPNEAELASFAASYSGGIFKKIDELFSQSEILELRKRVFNILKMLLISSDEACVYDSGAEFEKLRDELGSGTKKATSEEFRVVFDLMLSFAMDILKIKSGVCEGIVNADMLENIVEISKKLTYPKAKNCVEKVLVAQEMLSRYVNFKSLVLSLAIGIWDFS